MPEKEKKVRNITFKIDIDYLLRGQFQNASASEVAKYREVGYKNLCRSFTALVENFDGAKGVNELHNCDTKHKLIGKKYELVLDEKTKQPIQDDVHVHFILWDCKTPKTLTEWRKTLEKFNLPLTDESRKVKDLQALKKSNLAHAVAYLLHRTVKSIKEHKYAYDESTLVKVNVGRQEIEDLLAKGVEVSAGKTLTSDEMNKEADELTAEIRNGLTLTDAKQKSVEVFKDQQPQFWRSYHRALEDERQYYISRLFHQLAFRPRNFSLFYVSGVGGSGKSLVANQLGYFFADSTTHAMHITAPSGKKKTPDFLSTYKNELVSVGHEIKPTQFNVDEFENLFEPFRYPVANSRNNDKAYLAQATIITKALNPAFWFYNMLYSDYLSGAGAMMHYGWKTKINENNKRTKTSSLAFPATYAQLMQLKQNKEGKPWAQLHVFPDDDATPEMLLDYEYHWDLKGAVAFLNDWWQLLRRLKYVLAVSRTDDKKIKINVSQLNEATKPACLLNDDNSNMKVEDFFSQFDFDNHYYLLGTYECEDMTDPKKLYATLEKMVDDLKLGGLKVEEHLPKLMSEKEFAVYLGKEK